MLFTHLLMVAPGPYNPALRERGVKGRVAAAEPPSIRGFGFFNFVSTGLVAPTTCSVLLVLLLVWVCGILEESRGECAEYSWNRAGGVCGILVENSPESHKPVEIGDLRAQSDSRSGRHGRVQSELPGEGKVR